MSTSRRKFIKTSAAIGGAIGLSSLPRIGFATPVVAPLDTPAAAPVTPPAASLSILILGGTGFTGPEQVEYAIARGHTVTLMNRNKTRPDFFKGRV
ncbi:MAG: twin-arginine translocation signal domain-containing protein, partial [Gemmatimonadaceae bacterium]